MGDDVSSGERVVAAAYQSTLSDYVIYMSHVATYRYAQKYAAGKRVLDFGCGTGYGTHLLAADCAEIVGVDIAPDAIEFAARTYQAPNLSFRPISKIESAPLPFDDDSFDTVLSFQVIEHVDDAANYLDAVARVLRPGGTFVCATPDRRLRLFRGQRPWNVYHLVEYDAEDLGHLLEQHFATVAMHGMTGPSEIVDVEIRRWKRARLVALPLTFPGIPERARVSGLRFLKKVQQRRNGASSGQQDFGFDESVISIVPGVAPSMNLVAVATTSA